MLRAVQRRQRILPLAVSNMAFNIRPLTAPTRNEHLGVSPDYHPRSPDKPNIADNCEILVSNMKILRYSAFDSTVSAGTMDIRPSKADILMIKDVAEYLKVTERTIYRLAAAKKIPAFKVGGSWRFSLLEIDKWIQQQSVDALRGGPDA